MSGFQKPFANEKKPEAAPPKRGSIIGKLIKLIVLAAVLFASGTMVWQGKKYGEDAAIKAKAPTVSEDDARASAKILWPWQWTTAQWEGWYGDTKSKVTEAGQSAATTVSTKAKEAKAKLDEYIAKRKAAQPAAPAATPAAGATPAEASAAGSDAAATDLARADALIAQGGDLFDKQPADAKKKLQEAAAILKPYTAKQPVDPKIQEAYDRANNTIEALEQQQY